MLLVLNVFYNDIILAQVVKDLHRSRPWASDWLKRYQKEGLDGLKNRPKSGRPTELSEEISFSIKKELSNSKHGWTQNRLKN